MKMLIMAGCFVLLMTSGVLAAEPFAVVELFASEGCSSCPPADDLLRRLINEGDKDKRVFILTFEVDYWDSLGWKDPFSKKEFTKRQYQYADVLKSSSVYTPQMIINGQQAFVGSDESKAQKYINQYLRTPATANIVLSKQLEDKDTLKVTYHVHPLPENTLMHFALVDPKTETMVTSGENAGQTLKHSNVVLDFKTIKLNKSEGEIVFTSTSEISRSSDLAVIAYIQDAKDLHVLAASEVKLN